MSNSSVAFTYVSVVHVISLGLVLLNVLTFVMLYRLDLCVVFWTHEIIMLTKLSWIITVEINMNEYCEFINDNVLF